MEERHPFKIKNMSKAFIKEFWKDKKMIGSILPSSKFLAAKMLNHIPLENTKLIIELGPGTGIFTEKIIEKIDASTHLIVLELNPELCKDLKAKINLPNVHIKEASADKIVEIMKKTMNIFFVDLSYYIHHLINGYISYYKRLKLPEDKSQDSILSY